MNFTQLNLSKPTLDTLDTLGFDTPTEIQELAIPILLEGDDDFIGLAQTGTGKTLAFGIPLLEQIDTDSQHTQALILAPTRELGQQTAAQLELFSKDNRKLNVLAVYGGANISNQLKALKKPQHIIIATPGRLLDLLRRKAVKLDQLDFLVMDEADEMLNMGFKEDIDTILEYSNPNRLTWLFSATMSKDIRKIVKKYMHSPVEVQLNPTNETNENITHYVASLSPRSKVEALSRIIDTNPDMRGVVFCRTKRETQEVSDQLGQLGYKVDALHGDLSQAQRDSVMKLFKNHRLEVLVATDIAARGIDVQDITHVIHHNLPDEIESYTHRSGRTARAGKEGQSIALVSNRDYRRLHDIKNKLNIDFKEFIIPSSDDLIDAKLRQWSDTMLQNDASQNREVDALYNSIKTQFKDLTKDEILKNLLQLELKNFSASSKNLNEKLEKPSGNGRGGGGRGCKRGGNSGGRRGGKSSYFKKDKRNSGGGKYSGGKSKGKYKSKGGKRGK